MSDDIKKGLLGIVVDETEVSKVMPEINSLTYRGYAAQDLCAKCKFEEVAYLILNGELPTKKQLKKFENELSEYFETKNCIVTSNAVSALEIIVDLLDLNKKDEIIIPAHTYTASAYPFLRKTRKIKSIRS